MGMQARILLFAPDEATAARSARAAFDRIGALDLVMSDYNEDSELMRLCKQSKGKPVGISPDLFKVLAQSQSFASMSDGAFDVTIGRLTKLWRSARRQNMLPNPVELAEAKRLSGWKQLVLDAAHQTATLPEGVLLDLGGIAKGFASQEAMNILKQQGTPNAMIEFGGELVFGDAPPHQRGWMVRVENDAKQPQKWLKNCALSTSGDTEQFIEIDGKRYSHILDPRTGIGLTTRIGVSIIAQDSMIADGLSTLISVMGDAGLRLAREKFPRVKVFINSP